MSSRNINENKGMSENVPVALTESYGHTLIQLHTQLY